MQKLFESYDDFLRDHDLSGIRAIVMCGLPGSGKSTLGERLGDEMGYVYLSSDKSRVEVLKLTVGKLSTSEEYLNYKSKVYEYMRKVGRERLERGEKMVFDATHLNEQREILLDYLLSEVGLKKEEILVLYIEAGDKNLVRERIRQMPGKNADGRSWEEAWETAYDFFAEKIRSGEVVVPRKVEKGIEVVWIKNG